MLSSRSVVQARMGGRGSQERESLERLGQVNQLGSLADRVLLALRTAESRAEVSGALMTDTKSDEVLADAEALFAKLAESQSEEFDVTQRPTMSFRTMKLLRASGPDALRKEPDAGDPERIKEWFEHVRRDLAAVRAGEHDPVVFNDLVYLFDALAEMTLTSATSITRRDRTSERWTKTQHSF